MQCAGVFSGPFDRQREPSGCPYPKPLEASLASGDQLYPGWRNAEGTGDELAERLIRLALYRRGLDPYPVAVTKVLDELVPRGARLDSQDQLEVFAPPAVPGHAS